MNDEMALSSHDWELLNMNFQKLDQLTDRFNSHVIEDKELASAIKTNQAAIKEHLEECKATKARKKKAWYFWAGIAAAILAPIIALVLEHWLFISKVSSITTKP